MNSEIVVGTEGYATLQERYLRDPMPIRLGGLAANLARVKSFSNHADHDEVVGYLLGESQFFIEWIAGEADLSTQVELVELQRLLARWRLAWHDIWNDLEKRTYVATQAGLWSQKILERSGLLNPQNSNA